MKRIIIALALVLSAVCAEATQYSKRSIIIAAKQAGKWGAVKSWIASAGMTDEFNSANYISDEIPEFATATNMIVQAGIATSAEIESILAVSKDTAISDVLVRRMYASDMGDENGRRRWHGKVTSTSFDTNALIRVQIYEDGYTHESKFAAARPTSIDQKISAADLKARRDAAAKVAAEFVEKRRLARIAELQTNMAYNVQITMKGKKWPEDLATVYLQHELNTLVGTNFVNAIVTPK